MATLRELLSSASFIDISPSGPQVEETAARMLRRAAAPGAQIRRQGGLEAAPGSVRLGVAADPALWKALHPALEGAWMMVRVRPGGGLELLTGAEHLLYGLACQVAEELSRLTAHVAEVERKLKMSEQVLRFMMLRMEKIQIGNLHREVARRKEAALAPAPAPAPEAASEPVAEPAATPEPVAETAPEPTPES